MYIFKRTEQLKFQARARKQENHNSRSNPVLDRFMKFATFPQIARQKNTVIIQFESEALKENKIYQTNMSNARCLFSVQQCIAKRQKYQYLSHWYDMYQNCKSHNDFSVKCLRLNYAIITKKLIEPLMHIVLDKMFSIIDVMILTYFLVIENRHI